MRQRNITEFNGLDIELFFCTEILKLNSLHYGYWEKNNNLTLGLMKDAQTKYTKTLVEVIPSNVSSILDVGCGIGDVSRTLSKQGYEVTAISPDINHAKYFNNLDSNITFIKTKFEEFKIKKKFDLILMSESQNYFSTQLGFQQCTSYLSPQGYLLVSGMFRKNGNTEIKEIRNNIDEYIFTASRYGLILLENTDITQNTIPTIDFIYKALQNYIEPSVQMLNQILFSTFPLKGLFLKLILRKQLKRAAQIYNYYKKKINPPFYKENVIYARLLFKYV